MNRHERYLSQLPPDWPLRPISEAGQVVGGGTPSRDVATYWAGSIPWATPTDMTSLQGKVLTSTKESITEAGLNNSGARLLPAGSVVVTTRASLGMVGVAGQPLATNQGFKSIIPNREVDPSYLFHLLGTLTHELYRRASGTTFQEISGGEFSAIRIPCPQGGQQARIAEVLDTLDEAIRGADLVVAKLTTMKQAITNQLLTCGVDDSGRHRDRRLDPSSFKPAPYGWIPNSWEVQPAEALCEEIVVGIVVQPSKYYQEKGIPMLRSANVRANRIDPSDLVFMSPADNQRMLKSQIRAGNVVTVRTGSPGGPGTSCVVPPEFDGANCIDIVISRLGSRVLPEYFSLWLNSDMGKGQVTKGQIGLAQQHFNVGELKKLLVYVPPIPEQKRIVAVLFEFEETIRLESERRSSLQALKSGLSSDLLTGHVRVTTGVPA